MTKTPKYKKQIEENRETITKMLSGADTVKRLNNLNWVRHEISYTEPRTLFYIPNKEQTPYLDYNSMKNLGDAYDYIVNNPKQIIDMTEICKLHSMLCAGTYIQGGLFRTSPKIIEIMVNGHRVHAPDAAYILNKLIQNGYRPIVFNQRTDKQKYKEAITACANGRPKEYFSYMSSCLVRTQREIITLLQNSKTL